MEFIMSSRIQAAMFGAIVLLSAGPALAGSHDAAAPRQGHFEWRNSATAGPRTPLAAPRRLWVSSGTETGRVAACDGCPMGKHRTVARAS
jgi:hypothetical protein